MKEFEKAELVNRLRNYISENRQSEKQSSKKDELLHHSVPGIGSIINTCFAGFTRMECLTEDFLCNKESASPDFMKDIRSRKKSTFQEKLFEIIRTRNIDEVELYTKAQITKQTFSKIRSNGDYKPKKNTAYLLVLALHLNITESEDLLDRAGITFSTSSDFDLAIRFFIEQNIYDIFKINEILMASGIKTLAG